MLNKTAIVEFNAKMLKLIKVSFCSVTYLSIIYNLQIYQCGNCSGHKLFMVSGDLGPVFFCFVTMIDAQNIENIQYDIFVADIK